MAGGAKMGREMLNLWTAFVRFSLILRTQVQSYPCSHLFDTSLESLRQDQIKTVWTGLISALEAEFWFILICIKCRNLSKQYDVNASDNKS